MPDLGALWLSLGPRHEQGAASVPTLWPLSLPASLRIAGPADISRVLTLCLLCCFPIVVMAYLEETPEGRRLYSGSQYESNPSVLEAKAQWLGQLIDEEAGSIQSAVRKQRS